MNGRMISALAIAVAMAFTLPATGQTATGVVAQGPGMAGTAQRVKVTATVTALDAQTRAVTLKGPQGKEVTLTAGPDVRNFAQVKVGDRVDVEYVQALTLELKKGSTAIVERTEQVASDRAKPGERPGGAVGRQVTVMAEVMDVDPATQVVTLRGPQRTVDLKVADKAQFDRVARGDRVEATYTEALAIAVEPAKE